MAETSIVRNTRQKQVIKETLKGMTDFISGQDFHIRLQQSGVHIGLATIYRQLNTLAEEGQVDTVQLDGQRLYRWCGNHQEAEHHHHLICQECNKTIEIDPPHEKWLQAVAQEYQFAIRSHTFEIFGLCQKCAQEEHDEE